MLKHEKGICFKGGLEARRVTTKIADKLAGLKIKELWLACDKPEHSINKNNICPECNGQLVLSGGCAICYSCGYSKCS